MTYIVKVQRPMYSNEDVPRFLVYGKYGKYTKKTLYQELPKNVQKIMKKTFKAYFEATLDPQKGWIIGERVKDQEW